MTGLNAEYVGSFPSEHKCPKDDKPEYAFIGRSNVGKSSLINMITHRPGLAKVSGTPGKTQLLNFFLIEESWYLVDLPGYGYARISKKKRSEWERMIYGYLNSRETLCCAFVLIDANISPQKIDLEFCNWLGEHRVPFVIVYTKTDKSKPHEIEANIGAFRQRLLENWEVLPQEFMTSSRKKEGRDEILDFIQITNQQIENVG